MRWTIASEQQSRITATPLSSAAADLCAACHSAYAGDVCIRCNACDHYRRRGGHGRVPTRCISPKRDGVRGYRLSCSNHWRRAGRRKPADGAGRQLNEPRIAGRGRGCPVAIAGKVNTRRRQAVYPTGHQPTGIIAWRTANPSRAVFRQTPLLWFRSTGSRSAHSRAPR